MKPEILGFEKISKYIAIKELCTCKLSKEEVDEYLDIISAINGGQTVYNLITNNGEYLLYIDEDKDKDKEPPEKI